VLPPSPAAGEVTDHVQTGDDGRIIPDAGANVNASYSLA
jgi:hypothetical protein